MTLGEILLNLSSTEREDFAVRLQNLATSCALTLQAVHNLNAETRLGAQCWSLLIQNLVGATGATAQQQAIVATLRMYTLRGPAVPGSQFGVLGRAVTMKVFAHLLVKFGHYSCYSSAQRALRQQLLKPLQVAKRRWGHFELGRFLMWSTFNPDSVTRRPFDGFSGSSDEIRGLLGLDRNDRDLPLILFEYQLPSTEIARFPTVADAYAGDYWPYFFRPAPPAAPYGFTMPWPEYQDRKPRPEIVPGVLKVSELEQPLREIL